MNNVENTAVKVREILLFFVFRSAQPGEAERKNNCKFTDFHRRILNIIRKAEWECVHAFLTSSQHPAELCPFPEHEIGSL